MKIFFYDRVVPALLMLLAAQTVVAAQHPTTLDGHWFGVWKLDRSLSHLTGSSITIGRVPHGYHFDFGAVSFNVGDDGKDYPTVPTRSTSIKAVGDRKWLRVHKVNGKEVDHGSLIVTPDGNTLLIHTVATDANGKTHESDEKDFRVGNGTGLAGTWRSTAAGVNVSETIELKDAGAGQICWAFPKDQQYYIVMPDGKPASYLGAHAVPSVTVLLRNVSANEMRWTESINGKPYTKGIDTVSADGARLNETTWPVMRPQDKQEAVYRRD
jgi:hypothetical protein